jgi:hypothetical protein
VGIHQRAQAALARLGQVPEVGPEGRDEDEEIAD